MASLMCIKPMAALVSRFSFIEAHLKKNFYCITPIMRLLKILIDFTFIADSSSLSLSEHFVPFYIIK